MPKFGHNDNNWARKWLVGGDVRSKIRTFAKLNPRTLLNAEQCPIQILALMYGQFFAVSVPIRTYNFGPSSVRMADRT